LLVQIAAALVPLAPASDDSPIRPFRSFVATNAHRITGLQLSG
jgi:hypothetical protein